MAVYDDLVYDGGNDPQEMHCILSLAVADHLWLYQRSRKHRLWETLHQLSLSDIPRRHHRLLEPITLQPSASVLEDTYGFMRTGFEEAGKNGQLAGGGGRHS